MCPSVGAFLKNGEFDLSRICLAHANGGNENRGIPSQIRIAITNSCGDMARPTFGFGNARNQAPA